MNCNPFTLGHKYLIETAANSVEFLWVFVVEEDKSIFKFSERIELVRKGTEGLTNVVVVPSGKLMISSVTFPDYFLKEQKKEVFVDSSKDVRIFGKYVAPYLNINKRFVGEEPYDPVTRDYNNAMKRILPRYGLEVVEIPRLCCDKEAISASYVRKLIVDQKWEIIKKIVPNTTLEFLKKNYELLVSRIKANN